MTVRAPRAFIAAAVLGCATLTLAARPAPAAAANPVKPICNLAGWFSGAIGKACGLLQKGGRLVNAGKKLISGHPGQAAKALISGGVAKVGAAAGLTAVGVWVLVGAKTTVRETAKLIDATTSPQLQTTWFSSTYWRMAGIAAVLTLPFLFAAAVQAVMQSDLALLARAALGYLPVAILAVSVAAPVAMLLLAASDQMSAIVSSAAGGDAARALEEVGGGIGVLSTYDGSSFLAFLLGLLLAGGAFVLWLELLVREAAVYVVVLMLPLAFAALVWPARRMWAVRAVELLIALILAKFAIVAVLTLAAAGLGHKILSGPTAMLSGLALVTLAAFAPWALLRLLPMAEVASAAAGSLRRDAMAARPPVPAPPGDPTATVSEAIETGGLEPGRARPAGANQARDAAQSQTEALAEMREVPPAAAGRNGHGEGANGRSPAPPAPGGSAAPARERIPGMPAPWQQENGSWPVLVLGPEDEPREGDAQPPTPDPRPPAPDVEPPLDQHRPPTHGPDEGPL